VRLQVSDGRNFLLLTDRRYDVITADIIQPQHAGAGLLYSREYFELARRALDDDGVMLQWIGQRAEVEYRLIMRTFLEVFPDATLWYGGSFLVGSVGPLRVDPADVGARLRDPVAGAALERVGLGSVDDLRGWFTAGPDDLRAFVGQGPILTDDRPLLEYHHSLPPGGPPPDTSAIGGDPSTVMAVGER
jgi:spermidine synthase